MIVYKSPATQQVLILCNVSRTPVAIAVPSVRRVTKVMLFFQPCSSQKCYVGAVHRGCRHPALPAKGLKPLKGRGKQSVHAHHTLTFSYLDVKFLCSRYVTFALLHKVRQSSCHIVLLLHKFVAFLRQSLQFTGKIHVALINTQKINTRIIL